MKIKPDFSGFFAFKLTLRLNESIIIKKQKNPRGYYEFNYN